MISQQTIKAQPKVCASVHREEGVPEAVIPSAPTIYNSTCLHSNIPCLTCPSPWCACRR